MVGGRRSSGTAQIIEILGYKDLDVYKRAFGLLKPIHELVLTFPDYERFDLASQIRRAAKSVPADIGEGYAIRDEPKLFCKHLRISYGSSTEVRVHLDVARELEYLSQSTHDQFESEYAIVSKQVFRLWQHWRTKIPRDADDHTTAHDALTTDD